MRSYYPAHTLLIFLMILCSVRSVHAQNMLTGEVRDKGSEDLMIGVNVYLPELQKGTVTDRQGRYWLKDIPEGKFTIQYSFLGYETCICQISLLKSGTDTLDVDLHVSAIQAQDVIITGGRISTQHENAIKIEQVRKLDLDDAGTQNLMVKLASLPGVDAISRSNGIATPVIRGLSATNIVLLNNGIKMENFQFSVNHPYIVDESDISNIEIIKGPASLLYGSDAIGGVVNLIKAPPAAVNSLEGSLRSEFHSNYHGFTNRLVLKSSAENVFGGLSAYQTLAKDYTAGDGLSVPNSRSITYGFTSHAGLRTRRGLHKLSYDYGKMTPGMTLPQSVPLIEANGYRNEVWFQNLDNHLITSNNTLFYSRMKINMDLSYQMNHRRLQGSGSGPAFTLVDMNLQSLTWQLKSKFHIRRKSNLIVAWQGLYQSNRNNDAPDHVLPDYSMVNNSAVGLWQYNFSANSFYQFGVRFDSKWLNIPEQLHSHNGPDTLKALDRRYNNFSLSTGITQKLNRDLLLRANVASAYRTPSVAELMQDGVHADRYEKGNRDLTSQRNIEGDISLHYHTGILKIELAGFYNRIFDYIYLSPTTDTTEDGLDILRYAQTNATLYGFEIESEWSPREFLRLSGSFSHMTARQDDGEYLPFIPQDKLNGQVHYIIRGKGLLNTFELALNSLWAFRQNHPYRFETETDAYFLLNAHLMIQLRLGNQLPEAGIYFHNLLNAAYYDHLSTIKEQGYLNMGRNIIFKLKIPFGYTYNEENPDN